MHKDTSILHIDTYMHYVYAQIMHIYIMHIDTLDTHIYICILKNIHTYTIYI